MKAKKKLILTVISVFLIALIALIIWDPAELLRLRRVASAEGEYRVEEEEPLEINLSFKSIIFSNNEVMIIVSDSGDEKTLKADFSVSGNTTIVVIDYGQSVYSLFCKRKSNSFKLVGTTKCDYLSCSLHKIMEDNETIVGRFNAVK